MLTARPIVTPEDYVAALRLIERVVATTWPRANLTQAEFEYEWHAYYEPDDQRLAALWLLGDEPVGCLLVTGQTALVATLPGHEGADNEMFAWAEARLLPGACYAMPFESDARRGALLQRRGYIKLDIGENILARHSAAAPPPALLPAGYQLRSLTPADVPARAALYGRAFLDDDLSAERLQAVIGARTYRPNLDLLVSAPDGEPVAFATVWYDPANRLGIFEPVGCDPQHLRRGLARALMAEGLQRLHALGAQRVQITVGTQREPANRLYEAVGFQRVDQRFAWRLRR